MTKANAELYKFLLIFVFFMVLSSGSNKSKPAQTQRSWIGLLEKAKNGKLTYILLKDTMM